MPVSEELKLSLYSDATELVTAVASAAMETISRHLLEKDECHIALTGGTLGLHCALELVELINNSGDLTGLNIWFSDERFVASDSPLRNSRPVRDELQNSSVFVHGVASSDEGVSLLEAAALYDAELHEVTMDLTMLGLGPDGHVASLFPHHWQQEAVNKAIAIVDSPKPPSERISFSMACINSSAQLWIIAAGESKAVAVKQLLEADKTVPAGHVRAKQLTRLFLDSEAYSQQ